MRTPWTPTCDLHQAPRHPALTLYYCTSFSQQEAELIQAQAMPPAEVNMSPTVSPLTFIPLIRSTAIDLKPPSTPRKQMGRWIQEDIHCCVSEQDPSCTLIGMCSLVPGVSQTGETEDTSCVGPLPFLLMVTYSTHFVSAQRFQNR